MMTEVLDQQDKLASQCIEHLLCEDAASQFLDIKLVLITAHTIKASMRVRAEMLNGHKTCHGGFIFSFADSVFAFACNAQNHLAVASQCNIEFIRPVKENDILTATTKCIHQGKRNGIYHVEIVDQNQQLVAFFKGNSSRIPNKNHINIVN